MRSYDVLCTKPHLMLQLWYIKHRNMPRISSQVPCKAA